MRKFLTAGLAVAMLAVPASAMAEYSPPVQIPDHAQCGTAAGSGAFGALGEKSSRHDLGQGDSSLTGSLKLGADGPATGLANSAICGNR